MARGGKRVGAGRPVGTTKAEGMTTHVVRVSTEITKEQCQAIPSLTAILDYWEGKDDGSPRYHHLKTMLEEIRALGF